MTEISAIIRARLDEGRAIADEDVRQLLAERDALQARVAELEAAIYQYVNHVVSYEGISFIDEMNWPLWAKLINDTWVKQAALEGKKE